MTEHLQSERKIHVMRAVSGRIICVLAALVTLAARANSPQAPELLTVCDVLGHAAEYNGKVVTVLGRADCGPDIIDTSCFLAEDHCPQPLVTNRHRWPNKIWLQFVYDDEPSSQLSKAKLTINESAMAEKLVAVRSATKLGFHREMAFAIEGRATVPKWATLRDEWGVAYGRVLFRPKLKRGDNCSGGDEGCGGWNETPVMLLIDGHAENSLTFADDAYPPPNKR